MEPNEKFDWFRCACGTGAWYDERGGKIWCRREMKIIAPLIPPRGIVPEHRLVCAATDHPQAPQSQLPLPLDGGEKR